MSAPHANDGLVASTVDLRNVDQKPLWRRLFSGSATWVFLLNVVLVIFFTVLSPNNVFFSVRNLQNMLLNGSEGLLLALAMAMLLGAGLIDLSIGVNLVFSSVVGSIVLVTVAGGHLTILGGGSGNGPEEFTNVPLALLAGVVACVLSGVLFGLVNGLIITRLRVNSLIATLGTMSIGTGVVLLITKGSDIGGMPPELQNNFGLFKLFGVIPLPAIVAFAMAGVMWAIIRYLKFGMYTLAIGSSMVSAERAGIKVNGHILKLTMLAGGMAGVAGFINLAHFGSTTINGHVNDPLAAITAAVIGGAALAGGRVSIIGTIWGAVLALILLSGLVVIGVSAFYQLVVIGAILVIAVAVDQFRSRKRDTR